MLIVPQLVEKFPTILWHPKAHYRIHSSPLLGICATAGNDAAYSGNYWPTFRGQLVPSSRVNKSLMEQIGSPETSVRNCRYMLHYVSHQGKSRLFRGRSLKSSPLLVPTPIPIPAQLLLPYFFNIHFNISFHLRLGLASDLFPSGFSIKLVLRIYLSRLNNS